MTPRISLIGAGPGDPEFITVKAIDRLKTAEIVFHDKLSPNQIIDKYCTENAVIRDVGKRKGKVGPKQSEINQMLVESAEEYDRIVRLKGGDPFLFGRGGEETEYLADKGVNFEIIPGVTSLTAVPASAGIPLTHRDFGSSVAVITGHFKADGDGSHDWDSLKNIDTLVVMMGITKSDVIARKLLQANKPPQTPVALVGWGATPKQQSKITTLDSLAEGLQNPRDYLPGLVIIGEVVNCRTQLGWYENRPLFGQQIIVTRPRSQAGRFSKMLREYGADPIQCPTIQITPDESELAKLKETFHELDNYDWILFTSRNGVKYFFRKLAESELDHRALSNTQFGCIGPGTADELKSNGIVADLVPESDFKAEGFAKQLLHELSSESKILLPRSGDARKHLPKTLREHSHQVNEITIYNSTHGNDQSHEKLKSIITNDSADMITFTSSSTVDNLFDMFDGNLLLDWLKSIETATIGPITGNTLREYGVEPSVTPSRYTIRNLLEAIVEFYTTR